MKQISSISALVLMFLVFPFNGEAKSDLDFIKEKDILNTIQCPAPVILFTDTTYTINQNGELVITLYLTVNGTAYWVTYNPLTGQTTTDLPTYQIVNGSGPYMNPILVYEISSGPGCRGVVDTVLFQIPPGIAHCGNGSGNNGNGTGTNGNGSGNNGNGTGTNGNGSGNNGNGTGTNGNGNNGGGTTGPISGSDSPISDMSGSTSKLRVFPNPSTDYVSLTYDSAVYTDDLTFVLLDKYGIEVLTEQIQFSGQTIDVSIFNPGDYFYHILYQNTTIEAGILIIE